MRGNEAMVMLMIESGAYTHHALSFADFFLLGSLKQRKTKAPIPLVSKECTIDHFDCWRQFGQNGSSEIPAEYTFDRKIYLFELAYICGHKDLCGTLMKM